MEFKALNLDKIRENALKFAVQNAFLHGGKAQTGPVIGKLFGNLPELKPRAAEVMLLVSQVVEEVNSWTLEQQQRIIEERWPKLLKSKKKLEEKKVLPPLENVERFNMVKTRFAPNPDGALHLGSAEPIIFCDEYARMYDGKFILRFEDTSPDVKAPVLEIYDWIKEDVIWLGAKVDEIYYQSDRLEIYYKYTERLLTMGVAYICICDSISFKEAYMAGRSCPCRILPSEKNLVRWKRMLDGTYRKGEAVVRIKTDLENPNPALREFPILRVAKGTHPRQRDRYRVWPLYNFSCAIDDHLMEVSHIIRGKEHEVNTERQKYIYNYLGWEYPEIINIGRLGLEVGILSKSRIRVGINNGIYSGWDDPRLGTLKSLRRRGLQPETIRELMIQVGPKPINATLSWDHIASVNRRNIEPRANRYFFVEDPIELKIAGIDKIHTARLPLHPDHPEKGTRDYDVEPIKGVFTFMISSEDAKKAEKGDILRLMGLFNIEFMGLNEQMFKGRFHSKDYKEARKINASFIHWLPKNEGIDAEVVNPDATVVRGLAENQCKLLKVDDIIQFERFGFVRIDNVSPFIAYYSHR
jgi:glutamyl-tRNA synthetase